jgi:hypothetical protein
MNSSKRRSFVIATLIGTLIYFLSQKFNQINEGGDSKRSVAKKRILFGTLFFNTDYWELPNETFVEGSSALSKCSHKNCVFTQNKANLRHTIEYDAVFIHSYDACNENQLKHLPNRTLNQFYIIATKE